MNGTIIDDAVYEVQRKTRRGKIKLFLARHTPSWVLHRLWVMGLVDRTTIFRWEMNVALREWE